jgi:hypothetical protein
MLLMSIIPHEYFKNFLSSEKPNFLPYLQEIHLGKLYLEDLTQQEELTMLRERLIGKKGAEDKIT